MFRNSNRAPPLVLLLIMIVLTTMTTTTMTTMVNAADSSDDKCSATAASFYCPNCGGVNVTDCLSCDGYTNADLEHNICFDRKLFAPYNDDVTDPDNHYHYLWRDLVATFVWFIAAGIATACGVGGGGIYVPLGMILLAFAPKPASGLSQASIFGASLGGLILNIRDQHPNKHIEEDPDNNYDGHVPSGEPTYTRPLIDYDMALFLAPMEMAGAVLGVLIQKILPNWLYLTLAAIILGFTAYKTYKKWWQTRKKERAKFHAANQAAATEPTAGAGAISPTTAVEEEPTEEGDDEDGGDKAVVEAEEAADAHEHEHHHHSAADDADEAALHAKHVQTKPNIRKVNWMAPSNIYSYDSSILDSAEDNASNNDSENNDNGDVDTATTPSSPAAKEDATTDSPNDNKSATGGNWVGKIGSSKVVLEDHDDEEEEEEDKTETEGGGDPSTASGNNNVEEKGSKAVADNKSNGAAVEAAAPVAPATTDATGSPSSASLSPEELEERRKEWLERDARQYPREKLLALFILWIGIILFTFMKGGKGVESIVGITCESPWYGVLIALQFLWTFGFAIFFAYKLIKNQKSKEECNYPFLEQDVLWDHAKLRFYAFFTFVAGIVAGLIGIGGGMVLGPLMLVMGIHPRVSSATTGTMIVLTSSSVAVLFVTSGLVPWEYAVYFFCICFVGAYIGKKYIDGYVKRSGKASILIVLLATIIALATIGCVVIVLTRLAAADWCLDGFKKFCVAGSSDDGDLACIVERLLFLDSSDSSSSATTTVMMNAPTTY